MALCSCFNWLTQLLQTKTTRMWSLCRCKSTTTIDIGDDKGSSSCGFGNQSENTQASADTVPLTLDLLNPKSIGFDRLSTDRHTAIPVIKGFSFYHAKMHTHTPTHAHTYTHTHTHTSWQSHHTVRAAVIRRQRGSEKQWKQLSSLQPV